MTEIRRPSPALKGLRIERALRGTPGPYSRAENPSRPPEARRPIGPAVYWLAGRLLLFGALV